MNNNKKQNSHKILTIIVAITLVWSLPIMATIPIIVQKAMAENATNITTTTPPANTSTTLGNPIFIEHDKETASKAVLVNGTRGFLVSFSGNGMIKDIQFTDVGNFLVVFASDGSSDIHGKTVLTTINPGGNSSAEKATYTFQSIGLAPDANGVIKNNGAAFFHTASTTGKLASSINNLVVIFKDVVRQGKVGSSMNIGWEWK